jgi:CDP-diglyceride synthetase
VSESSGAGAVSQTLERRWSDLRPRLIALIVGLGVLALLLMAPDWAFGVAVVGVSFLCGRELETLRETAAASANGEDGVADSRSTRSGLASALVALTALAGPWLHSGVSRAPVSLDLLSVVAVLLVLTVALHGTRARTGRAGARDWLATAGGLAYCGILPAYLALLKLSDPSGALVIVTLAIAWGGDIGGYLVGRTLGRHVLWPSVSGRKTLEGAIGALGTGLLAAFAVRTVFSIEVSTTTFFGVVLIGQILAQAGDLLESAIKSRYSARHSGRLLPGEGGVLDILDGTLLAAPWIYYVLPP